MGWRSTLFYEGVFFSKAAVVTFGGAYAVLPYVAQQALSHYGRLQPGQMLDGLGLAETTPDPLIMVVQFVGFVGARQHPDGLPPLLAATLGAGITTWVTFVPCFLWIFLNGPHIERLRGNERLSNALSAITAAVVGVVLNLAVWFALRVFFPTSRGFDWIALLVSLGIFCGLTFWRWNVIAVIIGSGLFGLVLYWVSPRASMKVRALLSLGCLLLAAAPTHAAVLENKTLRITLAPEDASITVLDKRNRHIWGQRVRPGFRFTAGSENAAGISGTVNGLGQSYEVTLSLDPATPRSFDLVCRLPGKSYTKLPDYPFPFTASGKDWSYVQNTTGEGMLLPLDRPEEINKPFGWSGGQPWWGLTDLRRAMSAQLDSFRLPDTHTGARDSTVYAVPLRIRYSFFTDGSYVGLARSYRERFLRAHPELKPLRDRVAARPAVAGLKDSVYVYLWGTNPAEDLQLVTEMKAAGIAHGIAVFTGRQTVDRALFDGIKALGWVAGVYRMPTGNLFHVSKERGWPTDLLLGRVDPPKFWQNSRQNAWKRICAHYVLPHWLEKAKALQVDPGAQLTYFDTLVVQLAACLDPEHPATIEENLQARLKLMQKTRDLGLVVGSGEGVAPTWALPGLDFFEGEMSLRTYADSKLKIPVGDYRFDNGKTYKADAPLALSVTKRIPLYQLAFHDYVAGTWVWRDSNYQSAAFAHQKNLFNLLYGTMPMWHIDRQIWEAHKTDFIASYRANEAVRSRVGFAAMIDHGWLKPDRTVQYTDWDNGDRVVVNFGDKAFDRAGKPPLAGGSSAIEKRP